MQACAPSQQMAAGVQWASVLKLRLPLTRWQQVDSEPARPPGDSVHDGTDGSAVSR